MPRKLLFNFFKLRFQPVEFLALLGAEIAAVTGSSAPTVMRDLRTAEAWLRRTLSSQGIVLGRESEREMVAQPIA